jgi:acyl-[acyl-carrier-protein]-phospholipid O-acyltransferase/long-chain-fatty-acid--[acyl-carrier-protein] ligase
MTGAVLNALNTRLNAKEIAFILDHGEAELIFCDTELSPIVSINLPDTRGPARQSTFKPGKIGLPLPGVAVKILDQETGKPKEVNEDGLLFVKGPNVMKGYLHRDSETRDVIQDGWYRTGDIANLDDDGFLMITDRLSRFSKIGGEMVPHLKVEESIHDCLNAAEPMCVVTSVPDEKRGERLVVLYKGDVDRDLLLQGLKQSGLPKLWIPEAGSFFKIDDFPVLGTGKLDLAWMKRKALELVRPSSI